MTRKINTLPYLSIVLLFLLLAFSCNQHAQEATTIGNQEDADPCVNILTDIDSNTYKVVKIGEQYWMGENLKVTHFNTGTPIGRDMGSSRLNPPEEGMFAVYDNNDSNSISYGNLYNHHAVTEGNLCPEGWRVPSVQDWQQLIDHTGGMDSCGLKLQNDSVTGFHALMGGMMSPSGLEPFSGMGQQGHWWSSTLVGRRTFSSLVINKESLQVEISGMNENNFLSIRCIKDPIQNNNP